MEPMNREKLQEFLNALRLEEHAPSTIEKYERDVSRFLIWLGKRPLCKEETTGWKAYLQEKGYAARSINAMLVAMNRFLCYAERRDCTVKELKIQRHIFRSREKELTRQEYLRLVETARKDGRERLALMIETICATGIRVSEIRYITVEAVRCGRADVSMKGKIRTILIPRKLCQKLKQYAKTEKIASGEIFITRSGKSISRRQVWAEMKSLCEKAEVTPGKVFPHNLRKLFARTFYNIEKDIAKLADILGHSSIDTTRIYIMSTGLEHQRKVDRLGLVI